MLDMKVIKEVECAQVKFFFSNSFGRMEWTIQVISVLEKFEWLFAIPPFLNRYVAVFILSVWSIVALGESDDQTKYE